MVNWGIIKLIFDGIVDVICEIVMVFLLYFFYQYYFWEQINVNGGEGRMFFIEYFCFDLVFEFENEMIYIFDIEFEFECSSLCMRQIFIEFLLLI